jgi:chloramphenicol O-acetyltransferase
MKYRVEENAITATYSEYKIQKRVFFSGLTYQSTRDINSLEEALTWVRLKQQGYPMSRYYYGK